MAQLSPFINAQTQDYDIMNGKIVFANELATETYSRLVTPLNTYPFDLTFGCEIPGWVNTRKIVNAQDITNAVENALRPMIQQGRALTISTTVNSIKINSIQFTVEVTDTNNKTFKLTIPYPASS